MADGSDLAADVIVIGGGPAGSTAATMLARKGHSVLLLERERFPRAHVGESLLPASLPVLEALGVLPAVEAAGFVQKWGATMVWGTQPEPWTWYFRETNRHYPHAYQVWRPEFDRLLLENSRAQGVEVRQGHRVIEVHFDGERASGVRYRGDGEGERSVAARFIVDASGQSALIGAGRKLRRWDPFFRNMAVYAYFRGARRLPEPDDGNVFIESYEHGWFWNIPLHTGESSVGAVIDAQRGQAGISAAGPQRFLEQQIACAPHTARMLGGASQVSEALVVKDWSYSCDRFVGDGYILAGDAACFVDPLFSSGVHLALTSGVLAAAYVTSALKDPSLREPAARVYEELYRTQYGRFHTLAKLFYTSNRTADSYFWEARRLLDRDEALSPRGAFVRAVAGQPPLGYERAVLDRGEVPATFVEGVEAVEAERGQRGRRWATLVESREGDAPLDLVPRLAAGVRVERTPVIGDGEFEWGFALRSPGRPEGTPCSGLVAATLALVDGGTSVGEIIRRLHRGPAQAPVEQLRPLVLEALKILYIEGAIAEIGAGDPLAR